jgi:serine/threonine protein kinase
MVAMSIPDHIGRYEIRAEIERGGMATVYLAHDPRFDRDVAIKVLPREMLHDQTFRARFEREAHVIASLEHPAIVPVYDFGEDNEQPYLVMRYMTGGSLEDRINKGPLSVAEAARILSRIAQAMDEAHAHGIIHRDLKPGNILFDHRNEPYVSDFGIAKLTLSSKTLTAASIIGTPAYMSPEQARGEHDIDNRSDIYALGVILFEMLSGQVPFDAETPTGQMLRHITDPVPDILTLNPKLPPTCQTVIARAMAKLAFARYSSTTEMAEALTKVARGEPIQTYKKTISLPKLPHVKPTVTPKWLTSRPWYMWVGVGVVGLIFIALFAIILLGRLKPPKLTSKAAATTTTSIQSQPTIHPTVAVISPIRKSPTAAPTQPDTLTPTPSPSLTLQPSAQVVILAGFVEYTQNPNETFLPLELGVPISWQHELTIRTKTNSKAKLRLSDGSFLYLDQDTSLVIESIAHPAAGVPIELKLTKGTLLVQAERMLVNTLTGQTAEIDGGLIGVLYKADAVLFRVDCLEGSCKANEPDRSSIILSVGQSIGSEDWVIVPVDCAIWDALSGESNICVKTPTPENNLTPTISPSHTPTNTVFIKPISTPTRTRKPKTNTPDPHVPPS